MPKDRSPNYPAMGLTAALQGVRQVYDKEKRSPVSTEGVAKAMGHTSLSGPATSKVAALRQYGLIEGVSMGKYRVSNDALTVLLKRPGDPEYDAALREIALTPPLFKELYDGYKDASEDNIRYYLIKERDFSEEGASKVYKAFKDTLSVAKLDSESYHRAEDPEPQSEVSHSIKRTESPNGRPRGPRSDEIVQKQEGTVAYSWPLGGGNKVELGFASEPTQAQLDVMLAQLKIMREVAPTEAEPEPIKGNFTFDEEP